MYRKNQETLFENFIKGMDKELQSQLRLLFTRQMMMDEFNRKRELEQLKKEVVEEVLARIHLSIDANDVITKIKELDEAIKKLGK